MKRMVWVAGLLVALIVVLAPMAWASQGTGQMQVEAGLPLRTPSSAGNV